MKTWLEATRERALALALTAAWPLPMLLPSTAEAATMIYADVETLTEWSDAVVRGRVERDDVWLGTSGRITTRWRVVVDTTLKGEPLAERAFIQWAGELDGVVEQVAGDAVLTPGDDVILFLRGEDPLDMTLTALGQSVFFLEAGGVPPLPGGGVLHGDLAPAPPIRQITTTTPVADRELRIEVVAPAGLRVVRDLEGIGLLAEDGSIHEGRREVLSLFELMRRVRGTTGER